MGTCTALLANSHTYWMITMWCVCCVQLHIHWMEWITLVSLLWSMRICWKLNENVAYSWLLTWQLCEQCTQNQLPNKTLFFSNIRRPFAWHFIYLGCLKFGEYLATSPLIAIAPPLCVLTAAFLFVICDVTQPHIQ